MNVFRFPAGEAHCRLDTATDTLRVPMQPNLNDWLVTLLLACDANAGLRGDAAFDLILPYLPYARQDRPTGQGEPFSLKVIASMLNAVPCRRIVTLDVHSDVAFGCIDRLVSIPQYRILMPLLGEQAKCLTLVVPDQGAFKKLSGYADAFAGIVTALKHRDTATGNLQIVGVFGDFEEGDCLIMDDICDGGGTFVMLADYLLAHGAASVSLAITHGIFTKGIEALFAAGIARIYTTDSFPQTPRANLSVRAVDDILKDDMP